MIGIEAAIQMMGPSAATVGDLEQLLKCRCGGRVSLILAVDDRSLETIEREGRLLQTMGMVVREWAGTAKSCLSLPPAAGLAPRVRRRRQRRRVANLR